MEMHDIQIDDEVWQFLQERAVPLLDTPNSVLRRLLLGTGAGRRRARSTTEARSRSRRAPGEMRSPVEPEQGGTYRYMGTELRSPSGLTPRQMGLAIVNQEFAGEHFDRAKDRGGFRTMFESTKRLVYFLNFNKPDPRNMLFRVTASAIEALVSAAKPAFVVFSNPARRVAWVVPVSDVLAKYAEVFREELEAQDLILNIDIERNLLRELNWDIEEYRREV